MKRPPRLDGFGVGARYLLAGVALLSDKGSGAGGPPGADIRTPKHDRRSFPATLG